MTIGMLGYEPNTHDMTRDVTGEMEFGLVCCLDVWLLHSLLHVVLIGSVDRWPVVVMSKIINTSTLLGSSDRKQLVKSAYLWRCCTKFKPMPLSYLCPWDHSFDGFWLSGCLWDLFS